MQGVFAAAFLAFLCLVRGIIEMFQTLSVVLRFPLLVCLLIALSSCGAPVESTGQVSSIPSVSSYSSPSSDPIPGSTATTILATATSVPTPTEEMTETAVTATDAPGQAEIQAQIAFVRARNIWLFDLESGQETQLTSDGVSSAPTWSRDGEALTFVRERGEYSEIMRIAVDGSAATSLTSSDSVKLFPSYDRAGKLYFVRRQLGDTPTTEIVRLEPDGNEMVVHSEPGGLCVPAHLSVYDETQIALSLNCGRGTYVLLVNATMKSSVDLVQTYGEPGYCAVMAEWTDDGKQLVAITTLECSAAQNSHVAILDMTRITPKLEIMYSSNRIGNITLAPDKQSLIFERWNEAAEPTQELWLVDQRGMPVEPRRIVERGASPAWRPER
jgi:dipeptidyl aminopeptidase/acylaminoacyl peptidase